MHVPRVPYLNRIKPWHRNIKEEFIQSESQEKSKITVFVLNRLGSSNSYGREAMLPKDFSSRIMIDVLSSLAERLRDQSPGGKRLQIQGGGPRQIEYLPPIGLRYCGAYQWINAWMQFLIHLPKFTELVSFVGKSFDPFRVFVDQYMIDQKEGRSVSFAESASLVLCLLQNHPVYLSRFSDPVDFYEIFRCFFKSLFSPIILGGNTSFCDSIVFHAEWFMVLDHQELSQSVLASLPSEIMVAFARDALKRPQRQYFLNKGRYFYDLDAFIECRPDPNGAHYVTYVRIGGVWYQCEDEKIRYISSRTLSVPLSRGALFHYKRAGI